MSNSNIPTHRVYAVEKRANSENGFWRPIGAAGSTKMARAVAIKLDYVPLNGAEIVMRKPKPKTDEQSA